MRSTLFAAVLGLGAFAFWAAPTASAHPPGGGNYGNGAHDLAPHLHKTHTPFGPRYWYGNGPHDLMPHNHSVGPFGGVRSYSPTPFGPTTSYNGFPNYGGFGGYYGGYGGGSYPW